MGRFEDPPVRPSNGGGNGDRTTSIDGCRGRPQDAFLNYLGDPDASSGIFPETRPSARVRPLSLPGLVAIIYYSVCGGPFGTEDVISAAGPFYALLGFVVMPLVWSVPEALVAAELATTFPNNSGYVTWVTAAFGPFWGFLEGFLSWLSSVCDNAIYPVLFCAYLRLVWPAASGGATATFCIVSFSLSLSVLNYLGLDFAGWSVVALALFTICPFLYIVPAGLLDMEWNNLLIRPSISEVDWTSYLNVLFWNLNYWDSASCLAGEVHNARFTFPVALFITAILVFCSYVLPLVVGVGMTGTGGGQDWKSWQSGSLAVVGQRIGGSGVKAWVVLASVVSNVGQFVSEQASCAYQLQGMAQWGWLPQCFAARSRYGTPSLGLAVGLVVIIFLSTFNFLSIVDLLNGCYCEAQLLEFGAFIWLRWKHNDDIRRPYRVPLQSVAACAVMLFLPMAFCFVILIMPVVKGNARQVIFLIAAPLVGVLLHGALAICRRRRWALFSRLPPRDLAEVLDLQTPAHSAAAEPCLLRGAMDEMLLEPAAIPAGDDPVNVSTSRGG